MRVMFLNPEECGQCVAFGTSKLVGDDSGSEYEIDVRATKGE